MGKEEGLRRRRRREETGKMEGGKWRLREWRRKRDRTPYTGKYERNLTLREWRNAEEEIGEEKTKRKGGKDKSKEKKIR